MLTSGKNCNLDMREIRNTKLRLPRSYFQQMKNRHASLNASTRLSIESPSVWMCTRITYVTYANNFRDAFRCYRVHKRHSDVRYINATSWECKSHRRKFTDVLVSAAAWTHNTAASAGHRTSAVTLLRLTDATPFGCNIYSKEQTFSEFTHVLQR